MVRLIHIHSGKSVPTDAFVSVKYENNWFWIDKGDLESKQMFSLIMMLFAMVDTGPTQNQPVLTIPAIEVNTDPWCVKSDGQILFDGQAGN